MTPEDPRHGHYSGYKAGCHQACCRLANARQRNLRLMRLARGQQSFTSIIGVARRLQALTRAGWTAEAIGQRMGVKRSQIKEWRSGKYARIRVETHAKVARIYEGMCMELPPETTRVEKRAATLSRNLAIKNKWAPALAWDNIDDAAERPRVARVRTPKTDIDPVVIARALEGHPPTYLTPAERAEIVRQARAKGWPENQIRAITGIARGSSRRYEEAS